MALPLIPAAAAIASFIARSGVAKAIAKYGKDAVMAVGKNRSKVTKSEKKVGPSGSVPTKKPNVQGSKMPGGTRMPPNKLDVKAAQAARRKANEAAQMARGRQGIKKGATNVAAAATVVGADQAVSAAKKANNNSNNQAEVARLKRVGQRNAFKQAGEREAKKTDLAKMPAQAKAASDARQAARVAAKKKAEQARARKMSTSTTVTAKRSDVNKAREAISGPNARPQKPVAPPTAPKSDLTSSGTTTAPKGDRRTSTAAIVGEKSTGVKGAKNNPVTVGAAKKRKSDTFIGKDGRKKAAVTKEELEASGLSLREFLNRRNKARKPVKKNMGGKVMAYKSGGMASKFPDLNKDGKVTQADILQGRGVAKKNMGGKVKAYKSGGMAKGPMKKNMGGKVMGYKAGGGVTSRGTGKARKTNSCTMVKMKGS